MTSSQMKKAIDETISKEPMMNEAFVQKVLHGKNRRKKPIPFLQPALVVVMMLAIGAVLYFTPQQNEQSAVDVEAPNLTEKYQRLVSEFYSAILQRDSEELTKMTVMDSEDVLSRYNNYDLTKQLQVMRTIDEKEQMTIVMKLPDLNGATFLDTLVIHKKTEKIELDMLQPLERYVEDVALPKEFVFEYRIAPNAPIILNLELDLREAEIQTNNDHTLYQIPTDAGIWRVFETPSGERFDLNIVSNEPTQFNFGGDGRYYLIDSKTLETTFIYHNQTGEYQLVTGQLKYPGVTLYSTDYHEAPTFLFGGDEPKVITIEQGQLMYANVFEHADLTNSSAFYHTEAIGQHLLVKYTEDLRQISTYYEFTSADRLTDYRTINLLEAKPEHLKNMSLTNRYNDQLMYIFDGDTIYYRGRTNTFELVEKTYTNIQIETEGDQYFITGDDGFSWTLTRTAPRILQDEKGIEYTTSVKFEDLP